MIQITEELKNLIENNALAFATSDKDGNLHCIAVGDVKVVDSDKILIGDNFMRQTTENIKSNAKVALAVWNKNWKNDNNCVGYEISGTAVYFKNNKWHDMVKKIHDGCPAKGAILITINEIKKMA